MHGTRPVVSRICLDVPLFLTCLGYLDLYRIYWHVGLCQLQGRVGSRGFGYGTCSSSVCSTFESQDVGNLLEIRVYANGAQ